MLRDDARANLYIECLSLKRAAGLLDVHEDTIKRWWRAGHVELIRCGPRLLRMPLAEYKRLRAQRADRRADRN